MLFTDIHKFAAVEKKNDVYKSIYFKSLDKWNPTIFGHILQPGILSPAIVTLHCAMYLYIVVRMSVFCCSITERMD